MTAHPYMHNEALDTYLRARSCEVSLTGFSILVVAIRHERPQRDEVYSPQFPEDRLAKVGELRPHLTSSEAASSETVTKELNDDMDRH